MQAPENPLHVDRASYVICDSCKHRGTPCVSQEFPDQPSCSKRGDAGSTRRLDRVEALIEQLLKRSSVDEPASTNAGFLTQECDRQYVSGEVQCELNLCTSSDDPANAPPIPKESEKGVAVRLSFSNIRRAR